MFNLSTLSGINLQTDNYFQYTSANDYMTADPTVLEISGTDINPWTEVNKEETPDAKALGTEAYVNGSEWGEMENEDIVPVVK